MLIDLKKTPENPALTGRVIYVDPVTGDKVEGELKDGIFHEISRTKFEDLPIVE